jgi:uncharacterized protein YndB with AHSA1/START domain
MNKIIRTIKWFREVSILADDEQRRSGHPEIDVEHLFLALVSIGGSVTDALGDRGVTLATARDAFERLHAHRLSSLGIVLPAARAGTRRIPEGNARGGFVYREGVRKILELASNQSHQDVALLTALIEEPSAHIDEVLQELGVDADELVLSASQMAGRADRREPSTEYRRFVAAAPDTVWAMVSDPDRWMEWNAFEFDRAEPDENGIVKALLLDRQPNGRATRVRPEFRISEFVISRFEPPRLIQWERSFPGTGQPATQSLRLSIAPDNSGTELTLSFHHTGPTSGQRSLATWALRPLAKLARPLVVRAHLRRKADNISRALRQQPG